MSTSTEALLTREEAAALLGLKAATLATWACAQCYNLPYIKVGRSVRYRLSDIEAFLASRTVEPAAPATAGA